MGYKTELLFHSVELDQKGVAPNILQIVVIIPTTFSIWFILPQSSARTSFPLPPPFQLPAIFSLLLIHLIFLMNLGCQTQQLSTWAPRGQLRTQRCYNPGQWLMCKVPSASLTMHPISRFSLLTAQKWPFPLALCMLTTKAMQTEVKKAQRAANPASPHSL